jgi:plastocyanin
MKTANLLCASSYFVRAALVIVASLFLASHQTSLADTVEVRAGTNKQGPGFFPAIVGIRPGDTVRWVWAEGAPISYSVTSGKNRVHDGLFDSGIHKAPHTFSHTFSTIGRYEYFTHTISNDEQGTPITGIVEVVAAQPLNVSTRLGVRSGEDVLIGGFIISGARSKRLIVRAIGSSLQQAGLSDALADPVLDLRGSGGALIRSNDNWKDTQQAEIEATGVAPGHNAEAAIVLTLPPGSYTAVVTGKNGTMGVGLVEVYDLDATPDSRLANISTRGLVQTGENVMIGGFIFGNGNGPVKIIVRAIGPSLAQAGISGALADPTVELRDGNGGLVRSNNNWKESQQAEIEATGIPPQHELESAIVAELPAAPYTAIVRGANQTSGVALIEVYHLQ